jgi:serine/threonine-protein kinase RsbW
MTTEPLTLDFQIPAHLDSLVKIEEKVNDLMSELGALEAYEIEKYNFTLALHELCTNIIEHGYPGQSGSIFVALSIEYEPLLLKAHVLDSGLPFNATDVASPDLNEIQERGYGLFLIEQLVDEFDYTRMPQRNSWQLKRIIG